MNYIYKLENQINHKIYIGMTIREPQIRFEEHKRKAFDKNYYGYNYPIYQAIRKYGINNFSFEIIYSTEDEKEIFDKEKYYIQFYDSVNKGYNISLGGEGNSKYKTEDILKYWEQGKTCQEISDILGCQITTVSNRLKGCGITQEDIIKRVSLLQKKINADPILQFDLQDNFIKEWSSSKEIERTLGYSSNNIRSCCRGSLKTAYGYKWKRKNTEGPQRKPEDNQKER